MTCAEAAPLLSAYFDRELDVATSGAIAAHLRECEQCSAAVQRHEALRSAMSSGALVFSPPPGLERRIRKAVAREAPSRDVLARPWWRWAAVPLSAGLAAVLSWSVAARIQNADDHAVAELVSGHIRSLMVDHLVDVATSDRHTVKPWFNGKVDFSPPVVDLVASGFPLAGGRVDYIAGRPVAVLVYLRHQHVVNLFIAPARSSEIERVRAVAAQGYNLMRWSKGGLTFWAVSDVNADELERFAREFQAAG